MTVFAEVWGGGTGESARKRGWIWDSCTEGVVGREPNAGCRTEEWVLKAVVGREYEATVDDEVGGRGRSGV
jgi:hypothetical protein